MSRRCTSLTWLALGAVIALHGAFEASAAEVDVNGVSEAARAVRIDMDAAELCNQASWFPAVGSVSLAPAGCVSPMERGAVFFWLNLPEGLFRESQLRTSSVVLGGPSAGASALGVQILNHLIVAYAFDAAGVGIAVIGDLSEFPPTPSFLEGEILGYVDYDVPFEHTLHTTMDRHRVLVTQAGEEIFSAALEKVDPHPDPLNFMSFLNTNYAATTTNWAFASAGFKGVRFSGDPGAGSGNTTIGGFLLERSGEVIRVIAYP